jgi:hypothetical protein
MYMSSIQGAITAFLQAFAANGNKVPTDTVVNLDASAIRAASEGTPGSAMPTKVTTLGASDGTNAQALQVTPDRRLKVTTGDRKRMMRTVLTFAGKTAGKTYDVPHTVKYNLANTFTSPSTITSEFSQGAYGQLSTPDGITASVTTSTQGWYAQALFSFDILSAVNAALGGQAGWDVATLKTKVKAITVQWAGSGEGANAHAKAYGATLKRWSSPATWVDVNSNVATSPASITATWLSTVTSWDSLINDGILHILAHATYPVDDGTDTTHAAIASVIYTDYIQVTVDYEGTVLNQVSVGMKADGLTARATLVDDTGAAMPALRNNVVSRMRLDFRTPVAKTVGRIHDNPHVSKYVSGSTLYAPNTFPTELTLGQYTNIATQDGLANTPSTSANGAFAQQLFSFNLLEMARRNIAGATGWTVAELRDAIKTSSISWIGYGARPGGNGASVRVWSSATAAWVAIASNSQGTLTATNYTFANLTSYIDDAGFVHILATTDVASDGTTASTIYTDYVYLDVEFTGPANQVVLYGVDADGKTYRPVQVDEKGRFAKKVELVTSHNAVAITTTDSTYGVNLDLSAYREVTLRVTSTLDNAAHNADPKLILYCTSNPVKNGDGTMASFTLAYATYGIDANPIVLTKTQIPALEGWLDSNHVKIAVKCLNAPTTGSITVLVKGVPN